MEVDKHNDSFVNFYNLVVECRFDDAEAAWSNFEQACRAAESTPRTMILVRQDIDQILEDQDAKPGYRIFDHGCGAGFYVCYWVAAGYVGAKGGDVNSTHAAFFEGANAFFKQVLDMTEDVFCILDGSSIPHPDASFDYIYSNQVLEHVPDEFIDPFFAEELRVIRQNGVVRHSFPHAMCPRDSHTRTWFLSMVLPQKAFGRAVKMLRPELAKLVDTALFLRRPSYYRAAMMKYFGTVNDETVRRLSLPPNLNRYEGNRRLRNAAYALSSNRLLGKITMQIISVVSIKDLVSRT